MKNFEILECSNCDSLEKRLALQILSDNYKDDLIATLKELLLYKDDIIGKQHDKRLELTPS